MFDGIHIGLPMNELGLNIIPALIIGLIIAIMAMVKNNRLKAIIYSLPIPITITLIATGGNVDSNHLIGLLLVSLFLWCMYGLNKLKINIFLADIIATLIYIGVGYTLIHIIHFSFYWLLLILGIIWFIFVLVYHNHNLEEKLGPASKITPSLKLLIVSIFAYILLYLKSYLSGIIVTFPFSGVFAVIEGRNMLQTLAVTFTRNSLAIMVMFVILFMLKNVPLVFSISLSWAGYLIVLRIVTKLCPLKV